MLALEPISASWTGLDGLIAIAIAVVLLALGICVGLLFWPWRVEATAKAVGAGPRVSLAAGIAGFGVSVSAAAILDGPGVVLLQLRGRKLYERRSARVTVEALLDWLDARARRRPEPAEDGLLARIGKGLLGRVAPADVPALGLRVLLGLRDPSLSGAINLGFSDPAVTGKAAAVLYPLAGALAPFGDLAVSLDWSGRARLDGACEIAFRVVPARVLAEGIRFGWRQLRRPSISKIPDPMTTP